MEKLTIIEPCNFIDEPTGGQLTFVLRLLEIFDAQQLILVGSTSDKNVQIGKWTTLKINNKKYDFFPFMFTKSNGKKGLIPSRLIVAYHLIRFRKKIIQRSSEKLFIQSPEVLSIFIKKRKKYIYFCFPGTGNALHVSKYTWARPFAIFYDNWLMPKVAKTHKILAAADKQSIIDLESRSKGKIISSKVIQFPTRINEEVFKKISLIDCRKEVQISTEIKLITTCGRLSYFKGWELMLDAFNLFLTEYPNSLFIFIGNGEDEQKIKNYAKSKGIDEKVFLAGFLKPEIIATYLNASDLFVMGSFQEGWSTTLVEAACCGVPSVVTNFSSAKEIISNGINGYVVEDRNPQHFFTAMKQALIINRNGLPSKEMNRFGLKTMKQDFIEILKD